MTERPIAMTPASRIMSGHTPTYHYQLGGLTSNSTPDDKFTFGTNTKGDLIATHWNPHSVGGPVNSFNITEHIRAVVAEELAKARD